MKKIWIVIIVSLVCQLSYAQMFSLQSDNQELIKNAFANGLYLVKQEYILQDTTAINPKKYGRHGQPHYGIGYYLGVITDSCMLVDQAIDSPWMFDTNYDEYRDDLTKEPLLSKRSYRLINQPGYTPLKLLSTVTDNTSPFVTYIADSTFIQGLNPIALKESSNGWAIIASANTETVDTLNNITTDVYRVNLNNEEVLNRYAIRKINLNNDFCGGIYVIATYPIPGQVDFKLAGYITEINQQWFVIPIMTHQKQEVINGSLTTIEDDSSQAPIEQESSKKKRKNKSI